MNFETWWEMDVDVKEIVKEAFPDKFAQEIILEFIKTESKQAWLAAQKEAWKEQEQRINDAVNTNKQHLISNACFAERLRIKKELINKLFEISDSSEEIEYNRAKDVIYEVCGK